MGDVVHVLRDNGALLFHDFGKAVGLPDAALDLAAGLAHQFLGLKAVVAHGGGVYIDHPSILVIHKDFRKGVLHNF
ncbi:hypothetical protein SDC9_186389 [bioreactor metagenome]|uniref:Uncharacterized protein n=1 Tax=bioreactor metagenome TaxID=1076179 RepID=A0A645HRV2_9ZZZZ